MSKLPFHKQPGASALTGVLFANGASPATVIKYNLTAAVDPTVTDDSASGYVKGSQWLNTATNRVWIASVVSVGAAVWTDITAGGANGVLRETITQANAFVAGNVIRRTGGGYALAQADSASNANVLGVVETATGADFTIVYAGKIALTAHGFTIGAAVYLSPSAAGALTLTQPATIGQVDRQMGVVLDANTIVVMNARGIVVGAATGTVTSVDASGGVEVVAGAPITSSGTIRGAVAVNPQTGTTYTYLTGDRGRLVTHTNGSAIAGTLPQAGVSFPANWFAYVQNRGAGTLTITPTTSTIDGAASLALTTGQGVIIMSDGTNYFTLRGAAGSSATLPTGFTSTAQTITSAGPLVIAHGLGVIPRVFQFTLKNLSAERGYSVGDVLLVDYNNNNSAADNHGISVVPDATNVTIRFGSAVEVFYVIEKDTGNSTVLVNAKWEMYFTALA